MWITGYKGLTVHVSRRIKYDQETTECQRKEEQKYRNCVLLDSYPGTDCWTQTELLNYACKTVRKRRRLSYLKKCSALNFTLWNWMLWENGGYFITFHFFSHLFARICDYSVKMWWAFLFAVVRVSFKQVQIREWRNSPNGRLWTAALAHTSGSLLFRFPRAERSSCVLGTSSVGFVYIATCFIDFYFVDSSVDHGTLYRHELIKETCKVTFFLSTVSIPFR